MVSIGQSRSLQVSHGLYRSVMVSTGLSWSLLVCHGPISMRIAAPSRATCVFRDSLAFRNI